MIAKILNMIMPSKKISPSVHKTSKNSSDISDDIIIYIRGLFHDLRGPLNNISMAVDVMLDSSTNVSKDYDTLQTIKHSCEFMNESLNGFLNLQNIEDTPEFIVLKFAPFHIIGLLKKIQYILNFNINNKINLKYIIDPLHEWVIGDQKHLQYVLVNLVSNAIKNTNNNDTNIVIKIESKPIIDKKQSITISIIDDNESPIENTDVFLTNNSTSNDTSPDNLHKCKKIIEMHGGSIVYEKSCKSARIINNVLSSTTGNLFKIDLLLDICVSGDNNLSSEFVSVETPSKMENLPNGNLPDIIQQPDNLNRSSMDDQCFIQQALPAVENSPKETNKYDMTKFECFVKHSHPLNTVENNERSCLLVMETRKLLLNSKDKSLGDKFVRRTRSLDKTINRSNCNKERPLEDGKPFAAKVFIIDDSEISRKLLKRMFEQNCSNIKLYEAEDGMNAILKLMNRIHSVNLIMLDNIMPNITGVILSKILRSMGYKGLIIGITGNGLDSDVEEFINAGANYVFTKPFNNKNFIKLMCFIQKNGYITAPNGKIILNDSNTLVWKTDISHLPSISSSVDFTDLRSVTSMKDLGFSMPLRGSSNRPPIEDRLHA
jgi:CheY-like chemotaxis protein